MNKVNTSFLTGVEDDFYPDPSESVLDTMFEQYEKVIFSSIITAFGLDRLIKDQHGGDVDTIHNLRKNIYKNKENIVDYDNRGAYNSDEYHNKNYNYRSTKHNARKSSAENGGVIEDGYTGRNLAFGKSAPASSHASLEHILSAKNIHYDRGRILAGGLVLSDLNGTVLANDPTNLVFTNSSLNSSMGADEIPDYIAKHPELPEEEKERMLECYNKAKAAYEKKLAKAYYLNLKNPNCRCFYLDTAKAAGKRGFQMGVREALGFVLTEIWFCIKDKLKTAGKKIEDKFSAITEGVKDGFKSAKEKYKDIISEFGQGIIGGIMSSLSTTLCNIFFTTSQNIVRIIRQAWSSIVEATKIILFNPDDMWFCDRITAALKILASGASVIIGSLAQESVQIALKGIPSSINGIISTFAGTLCTGLLTVTLLFYIDNNPFDSFLNKSFYETIGNYKLQAKRFNDYCSELNKLDIKGFADKTHIAGNLALAKFSDDKELNWILKETMKELNIKCPWGERSLDDAMNDENFNLVI